MREASVLQMPSPPRTGVVGDLLVCSGGKATAIPGRLGSPAWDGGGGEGWSVRCQPPAPGWRGYPIREVSSAPWRLRLLGEACGSPHEKQLDETLLAVAGGALPASELNGHFLLLAWNEAERRWHVWTDRFGTLHAYYATDGRRSALGTFFPAVAAAASRRRLDWLGLAGFFAFGYFPQDRTFFDDARILRPGTHCVFDDAGRLIGEERYFLWRHAPDPRRGFDDTVEEFAQTFHEVLDDLDEGGRLAVPISGGLDSRSTVAALTRPGRAADSATPWSYSYGYTADSVETKIAGRIAAARGLPFRAITIGPYLFDRLASVLSCVEGFQDVTQSRQAAVADLLASEADAVIAAHWGDVWLDDMGLEGGEAATADAVLDHALKKILKRGRGWLLEKLVGQRLGAESEPVLRDAVEKELARVGSIADPDFRVKAFKTEQWSFRWTLASIRMYRAGAVPRLPFYDTRLTDFFATVPSAFVKGRRLQIEYLKRFAPDLARITWQAYDTDLFRVRHFRTWLLPSRAIKKVARSLGGAAPPERNWEVQFLGEGGRRGLEAVLLKPAARLHEFVSPGHVRALLADFFDGPLEGGRGYTVSMLLTFAAWLEAHG